MITGPAKQELKTEIKSLVQNKEWRVALDKLSNLSFQHDDPWIDSYLCNLRLKAFKHIVDTDGAPNEAHCPPMVEHPFPECIDKIPEIDARELTLNNLAGGIKHHGSIIVRNFIGSEKAKELKKGIDRVMNSSIKYEETEKGNIWFKPLQGDNSKRITNKGLKMMRESGSARTLLSPRMTKNLIGIFNDLGLKEILHEYFNEAPCLSLNKWVLRKMNPLTFPADWHQDGAFMGKEIKSVNLWMALTECGKGTDKAGMDIIPKRLNDLVPTGTEGAIFKWSVSRKYVDDNFNQPERPHFNQGDAIFFDHLNLHSTSYSESFKTTRYAIETWFFAASSSPQNQMPVVW